MSIEDEYDWHEPKRAINLTRHAVDFNDANVFDWDTSYTREDDDAEGEQRFFSLGLIYGVLHAMVWTEREGVIWVISLRKASRPEIRLFER